MDRLNNARPGSSNLEELVAASFNGFKRFEKPSEINISRTRLVSHGSRESLVFQEKHIWEPSVRNQDRAQMPIRRIGCRYFVEYVGSFRGRSSRCKDTWRREAQLRERLPLFEPLDLACRSHFFQNVCNFVLDVCQEIELIGHDGINVESPQPVSIC